MVDERSEGRGGGRFVSKKLFCKNPADIHVLYQSSVVVDERSEGRGADLFPLFS